MGEESLLSGTMQKEKLIVGKRVSDRDKRMKLNMVSLFKNYYYFGKTRMLTIQICEISALQIRISAS